MNFLKKLFTYNKKIDYQSNNDINNELQSENEIKNEQIKMTLNN